MKTPTIHLNGTSRDELICGYIAAMEAIQAAIDKLCSTAPNSRDYYTQGDGAFRKAAIEHASRVRRLEAVRLELQEIAEAIA